MRRYFDAVVGAERTSVHQVGPLITAAGVEVDDADVTVGVSVQDPRYLGTFERTAEPRMITVSVNARGPAQTPGRAPRPVDLPVREQIAWVRVVLGDLADFAYRILDAPDPAAEGVVR